jgi:RNA polymerase sigma factor (sigma-70 family)
VISASTIGEVLASAFEVQTLPLPAPFTDLLARIEAIEHDMGEAGLSLPDAEFKRGLEASLPFLRSYGRSLTRNPDEADDLVQETVLRALAKRALFQPGSNMRAWLATIQRNLHLTGRRRARFQGDWDEMRASRLLSTAAGQEHQMHLRDVVGLLGRMSVDKREALMLVAVDSMSYEEVAAATGVCIGTVKSRVSRARQMLGKLLDGQASKAPVPGADLPMNGNG